MGPSFWQILIVVVIVLFIFGPKRIPGLGKSLGEAIRGFRKGISGDDDNKNKDEPSSSSGKKLDASESSTKDLNASDKKPPSQNQK